MWNHQMGMFDDMSARLLSSQLAQTETYTASGGSPKSISIILIEGPDVLASKEEDGSNKITTARVWIDTTSAGIIAPKQSDTLTVNGTTLVVMQILNQANGMAELHLQNSAAWVKSTSETIKRRGF